MTTKLKLAIGRQILKICKGIIPNLENEADDVARKLAWCIRTANVGKTSRKGAQFVLDLKLLRTSGLLHGQIENPELVSRWQHLAENHSQDDSGIPHIIKYAEKLENNDDIVKLKVDHNHMQKVVLQDIIQHSKSYGTQSIIHEFYTPACDTETISLAKVASKQTVVVEFSSPNIAKSFHAGHLRSTVLGNVIANLYSALGHKVIRLNYLGDWGTQFGLLGVGFQKYGSEELLKTQPMEHLFDVYVKINTDADVKRNPEEAAKIHKQALQYFRDMEKGDAEKLKLWRMFRDISIEDYKAMYHRMGVEFDEYDSESMYHSKCTAMLNRLKDLNILEIDQETGMSYVDLQKPGDKTKLFANVLKSDGSTLYITRDLAAIIDRYEKYQFNKIFYVVGSGQALHFTQLNRLVEKLGYDWLSRQQEDFYCPFGHVEGMSTRRGNVIFLRDILNEAKTRMLHNMQSKKSTKATADPELVADQLALSCVIVYNFKMQNKKHYKFDWDKVLKFDGQTGVLMHYTHARLFSLETNCGVDLNKDCDCSTETLGEESVWRLVVHLAKFDEVVYTACHQQSPHHIVYYLFTLSHLINTCLLELPVKSQPLTYAEPRLLLFHCARITLGNGMRLLGMTPLDRM